MAGAVGIEPTTRVLETLVIPFHHAPTLAHDNASSEPCPQPSAARKHERMRPLWTHAFCEGGGVARPTASGCRTVASFRLLVRGVLVAPPAKLLHFEPGLERLLVLVREIVDAVASRTLELDEIVLRHMILRLLRDERDAIR